jgi:hypothetical protein
MDITGYNDPLSVRQIIAFLQLKLPTDIKRKIYEEYFKKSIIYNRKYDILMKEINSEKCLGLDTTDLKPIVKSVIEHPNFCAFVQAKNALFDRIYVAHYINGNKMFINIGLFDSLVLSWLMYLYH